MCIPPTCILRDCGCFRDISRGPTRNRNASKPSPSFLSPVILPPAGRKDGDNNLTKRACPHELAFPCPSMQDDSRSRLSSGRFMKIKPSLQACWWHSLQHRACVTGSCGAQHSLARKARGHTALCPPGDNAPTATALAPALQAPAARQPFAERRLCRRKSSV